MEKVQRYNPEPGCYNCEGGKMYAMPVGGEYVKATDYDALAARVAELEADARRWNHARSHLFRNAPGPNMGGLHKYCPTPDVHYLRGPTLDAAIDAHAQGQEESHANR